jgi:hypothetical protein
MFRSQSDHHQRHHTHVCALHALHCLLYRAYTKEWCGFNVNTNDNRTIRLCIPCICVGIFVFTLFHDSRCRRLFITIVGQYVISCIIVYTVRSIVCRIVHFHCFDYTCYHNVRYQNVHLCVRWALSFVLTMFLFKDSHSLSLSLNLKALWTYEFTVIP